MTRFRFPSALRNVTSFVGMMIAALALFLAAILLTLTFFQENTSPYQGIFVFLILPAVLLFGVILIPIGAIRRRRWLLRHVEETEVPAWPVLDLNRVPQRNAVVVFTVLTVALVAVGAVGSYQGYHYTESVEFCGQTCHEVMNPEYVAYQNSAHARVPCASCHIGSGADWYVKSKLSGAYQVYAYARRIFPRPIPTPIANLRPAQQTCEQCHWPEKFFGNQQKVFDHVLYDEANSDWPIELLLKTGGGDPRTGAAHGIHWHMNIGTTVEYIARDEERRDIPWMRVTDRTTKEVRIYQNTESPLSEEEKTSLPLRVMDCMDCHNRPSHVFNSPDSAIDFAIVTNRLDRSLPEVKRIAVQAMAAEYATDAEARAGIAKAVADFYRDSHPETWAARQKDVEAAIVAIQGVFSENLFPEMKVNWKAYPGNLGHHESPGCMRCHTSKLKTETGIGLSTDCNTCHTILAQGSGANRQLATTPEGLEFQHPADIGDMWKETPCYECHTGAQP